MKRNKIFSRGVSFFLQKATYMKNDEIQCRCIIQEINIQGEKKNLVIHSIGERLRESLIGDVFKFS